MRKKKPDVRFSKVDSFEISPSMSEEHIKALIKKRVKVDTLKLIELCKHFEIEPSNNTFYDLSLVLARELYPENEKVGAKKKWDRFTVGCLVVEVENLAKPNDPTHGVTWACNKLAKSEPWKSFINTQEKEKFSANVGEPLRKQYYRYKDEDFVDEIRKIYTLDEGGKWQKLINDTVKNQKL